ncbi:MAG: hypothetical protein ACYCOU_08600 [Sulfobacillus sp.]
MLTRTSRRPNYFYLNYRSVHSQSVNVLHLVSVDESLVGHYTSDYPDLKVIPVSAQRRTNGKSFPFGAYLNDLVQHVNEGWIVVLDDDDHFAAPDSLERALAERNDDDTMIAWKMDGASGSSVGYLVHSKYRSFLSWSKNVGNERQLFDRLCQHPTLKVRWLDFPVSVAAKLPGGGRRTDLKIPKSPTEADETCIALEILQEKEEFLKRRKLVSSNSTARNGCTEDRNPGVPSSGTPDRNPGVPSSGTPDRNPGVPEPGTPDRNSIAHVPSSTGKNLISGDAINLQISEQETFAKFFEKELSSICETLSVLCTSIKEIQDSLSTLIKEQRAANQAGARTGFGGMVSSRELLSHLEPRSKVGDADFRESRSKVGDADFREPRSKVGDADFREPRSKVGDFIEAGTTSGDGKPNIETNTGQSDENDRASTNSMRSARHESKSQPIRIEREKEFLAAGQPSIADQGKPAPSHKSGVGTSVLDEYFDHTYFVNLHGNFTGVSVVDAFGNVASYQIRSGKTNKFQIIKEIVAQAQSRSYRKIAVFFDDTRIHRNFPQEFRYQMKQCANHRLMFFGAIHKDELNSRFDPRSNSGDSDRKRALYQPEFYRQAYPELRALSDDKLRDHWIHIGCPTRLVGARRAYAADGRATGLYGLSIDQSIYEQICSAPDQSIFSRLQKQDSLICRPNLIIPDIGDGTDRKQLKEYIENQWHPSWYRKWIKP